MSDDAGPLTPEAIRRSLDALWNESRAEPEHRFSWDGTPSLPVDFYRSELQGEWISPEGAPGG